MAFWPRYIDDYLSVYYKDDAAIAADTELQRFWSTLVGVLAPARSSNLVEVQPRLDYPAPSNQHFCYSPPLPINISVIARPF